MEIILKNLVLFFIYSCFTTRCVLCTVDLDLTFGLLEA